MNKDLAYYQSLPYGREWLPLDDESGRYFVVRLRDLPDIYGTGHLKSEALHALWSAFDDMITWCIEEGINIPEPALVRSAKPDTIEIRVRRISEDVVGTARQKGSQAPTLALGSKESFGSDAVNVNKDSLVYA
jgi:predicted RNase H-like HicB family nuclease